MNYPLPFTSMYSTCLHCTKSLGTNDVLETLPVGRRIAFDAAQGRLWVVCRHCAKWNLVPFDTRLESIDACERLYRDTFKRYSTGAIGMARARDGLDLVRIGPALRPEFAAWRYGESYRRRRRNAYIAGGSAVGVGALLAASAGVTLMSAGTAVPVIYAMVYGTEGAWKLYTHRKRGFVAPHPTTGRPTSVGYETSQRAMITWETDLPTVEVPVFTLRAKAQEYLRWSGVDASTQGRRLLGGMNLFAGRQRHLDAASLILGEHGGDLLPWLRSITARDARIGGPNASWRFPGSFDAERCRQLTRPYLKPSLLPDAERLAIEMWMNEDIERVWLAGELRLLEREWQEAEKLAKIADELVVEGEG